MPSIQAHHALSCLGVRPRQQRNAKEEGKGCQPLKELDSGKPGSQWSQSSTDCFPRALEKGWGLIEQLFSVRRPVVDDLRFGRSSTSRAHRWAFVGDEVLNERSAGFSFLGHSALRSRYAIRRPTRQRGHLHREDRNRGRPTGTFSVGLGRSRRSCSLPGLSSS